MAASSFAFASQINCSVHNNHSASRPFNHIKTSLSSTVKPLLEELQKVPMKLDVSKAIANTSQRMLDGFVDSLFQFVDQPYLPTQKNFAPVEEIGEPTEVACTEGEIPADFSEGIYIRNGPNPLFGSLKSAVSIFGKSSHIWVEGEGMLHALRFRKNNVTGKWTVTYNNRFVETKTYKLKRQRNNPSLLPTVAGDSTAIIAGFLLNALRFGSDSVNEHTCNTSVIEHSGKHFAIAENYIPYEIDISTLETFDEWNINGAWNRPFTSHPKKAPGSGELVIMGFDAKKPHFMVGILPADGLELSHKVDLKFDRCVFSHEIGVTLKYNVIMDHPVTIEPKKLLVGKRYIDYDKEGRARIGVMPRYGDADSVKWFDVNHHCTFHLFNCFEDGDEVVVRGCRSLQAILPGPDSNQDKFEWFSRGFNFTKHADEENHNPDNTSTQDGYLLARAYEWRLNMVTEEVKERNLSSTEFSMDFPFVNEKYTGLNHKYGYAQVIDSLASSNAGLHKYGALAKLHFDDPSSKLSNSENKNVGESDELIKVEYHKFPENNFCCGTVFEAKHGGSEEDDGWVISFVHNEDTDVTQVHIIDAKKFEGEPVAKITLPQRVPYGFHGTFLPMPSNP